MLSDFFTHPLPETFNWIEVWAVGRELHDLNAELAALKASKPKRFWARLLGGGE